jgi:hypothetical protein
MTMVLRSLYLDPKLDAALAARAEHEGITKAELMRRFFTEGLERPAGAFAKYVNASPAPAPAAKTPARPAQKKPAPARRVASARR